MKTGDKIQLGGGWAAFITLALAMVLVGTWGRFGLWVALAAVGGLLLAVVWVTMLLVMLVMAAASAFAQAAARARQAVKEERL